jgi:FecR protein
MMPIVRPIGGQPASLAPLLLFMLLWINGCQSPAPQPAGTTGSDPGWTITGQAGSVSLRSPHQSFWHRARPGARIPPGSQVVTFDGSRLEIASAGDKLTTSGPSHFTLPESGHDGVRVRQDAGSLRYEVRSAPKRRFEVKTPHFSTVVKGTTFLIAIDRSSSEVFVDEGRVLILDLNGQPLGELATGQAGRMGAQPGATLEVHTGPAPSLERGLSFERGMSPGPGLEPSFSGNSASPEMTSITRASLNAPMNEAAILPRIVLSSNA